MSASIRRNEVARLSRVGSAWRVRGCVLLSFGARAQFSTPSGNYAGTAGASCTGLGIQYAWPDINGQILQCVSNVWTVVPQTAAAAGSSPQLQYNNSGLLGGTAGLTYDSTNQALTLATIAKSGSFGIDDHRRRADRHDKLSGAERHPDMEQCGRHVHRDQGKYHEYGEQ